MANNKPTLAQRREALVALCAAQRAEASQDVSMVFAPSVAGGGGLLGMLGGGPAGRILQMLRGRNLKIPLAIAGVVLGMIVVRPGRMIPLITTGLSLWKLAQPVLDILRRPSREHY